MIRNQYSYWLVIYGEDVQQAARMVEDDGTLVCWWQKGVSTASFCVSEDLGTIEEWTDMESVLLEISTACPQVTLDMLAIDEDTGADHCVIYHGGACVKDVYSRQVSAGDRCDYVTAEQIVQFLNDKGLNTAADLVREAFLAPEQREEKNYE